MSEPARVYLVSSASGADGSSGRPNPGSSSLADLLQPQLSHNAHRRRKRPAVLAQQDAQLAGIQLLQDFAFPEASQRVRSTADGAYVVATGTYKPQIRVWECDQLSLKLERHTEHESVDFVLLADDWTKQLHLQNDRHLEIHAQGGHHARVRIPRFGRALGYHFPSADAVVGASGNEVYRLNLDQGRFLAPFVLGGSAASSEPDVLGVNSVDVNPAHGLLSFGTESTAGIVEMWDPRARRRAGALSAATRAVLDAAWQGGRASALPGVHDLGSSAARRAAENTIPLGVTALKSAQDGLNLAVGTSTGHTLLYDLRMARAYATKDQGFGVPITSLAWPGDQATKAFYAGGGGGGGGRMLADTVRGEQAVGTVLSADAKSIKVWKKDSPAENVASITPPPVAGGAACDLNDVHHIPGTGLILAAVEAAQMAAWYVPALGPAPRWCAFLDSLTDELDTAEAAGGASGGARRGVYENFKFVDRGELERLGMDGLIGTDLLRPYMHGYFVALGLYEKARLIANPTAQADAQERAVKARLAKDAESRIRTASSKSKPKTEPKKVKVNQDLVDRAETKKQGASTLLGDDRFKDLFSNPEFQIDTSSREFQLRNPGAAPAPPAAAPQREPLALRDPSTRRMTAVEQEMAGASEPVEDEDAFAFAHRDEAPSSADDDVDDERAASGGARVRGRGATLRDGSDDNTDDDSDVGDAFSVGGARQKSFKERMRARAAPGRRGAGAGAEEMDWDAGDAGREVTWTPANGGGEDEYESASDEVASKKTKKSKGAGKGEGEGTSKKDKTFGAGLSKGAGADEGVGLDGLSHDARFGRTARRNTARSASRNAMRSQ